jgi:hypothetical protein
MLLFIWYIAIKAKVEDMKHDINSHIDLQLESFITKITELLNIPIGLTSFEKPSNPEGVASSNSQNFQSNPLHHDSVSSESGGEQI